MGRKNRGAKKTGNGDGVNSNLATVEANVNMDTFSRMMQGTLEVPREFSEEEEFDQKMLKQMVENTNTPPPGSDNDNAGDDRDGNSLGDNRDGNIAGDAIPNASRFGIADSPGNTTSSSSSSNTNTNSAARNVSPDSNPWSPNARASPGTVNSSPGTVTKPGAPWSPETATTAVRSSGGSYHPGTDLSSPGARDSSLTAMLMNARDSSATANSNSSMGNLSMGGPESPATPGHDWFSSTGNSITTYNTLNLGPLGQAGTMSTAGGGVANVQAGTTPGATGAANANATNSQTPGVPVGLGGGPLGGSDAAPQRGFALAATAAQVKSPLHSPKASNNKSTPPKGSKRGLADLDFGDSSGSNANNSTTNAAATNSNTQQSSNTRPGNAFSFDGLSGFGASHTNKPKSRVDLGIGEGLSGFGNAHFNGTTSSVSLHCCPPRCSDPMLCPEAAALITSSSDTITQGHSGVFTSTMGGMQNLSSTIGGIATKTLTHYEPSMLPFPQDSLNQERQLLDSQRGVGSPGAYLPAQQVFSHTQQNSNTHHQQQLPSGFQGQGFGSPSRGPGGRPPPGGPNDSPPRSRRISDYSDDGHGSSPGGGHPGSPGYVPAASSANSLSFEWRDVSFSVGDKEILNDCYGRLYPGEVCALLGPSGAGKSTLMNLLAARQRWSGEGSGGGGKITFTGDVMYGGCKASFEELKNSISYVMQEDHMMQLQTVEETLMFSAKLRLPNSDQASRERNVKELIELLELQDCKDVLVGGGLIKGISGGQKKRVSAGVELVTRPSVLFLDEPTSGLDSYSSLRLIENLRKFARTQNSIICATIHQPSSELFDHFDRVMCMRKGRIMVQGITGKAAKHALRQVEKVFSAIPDARELQFRKFAKSHVGSKIQSPGKKKQLMLTNSGSKSTKGKTNNLEEQNDINSSVKAQGTPGVTPAGEDPLSAQANTNSINKANNDNTDNTGSLGGNDGNATPGRRGSRIHSAGAQSTGAQSAQSAHSAGLKSELSVDEEERIFAVCRDKLAEIRAWTVNGFMEDFIDKPIPPDYNPADWLLYVAQVLSDEEAESVYTKAKEVYLRALEISDLGIKDGNIRKVDESSVPVPVVRTRGDLKCNVSVGLGPNQLKQKHMTVQALRELTWSHPHLFEQLSPRNPKSITRTGDQIRGRGMISDGREVRGHGHGHGHHLNTNDGNNTNRNRGDTVFSDGHNHHHNHNHNHNHTPQCQCVYCLTNKQQGQNSGINSGTNNTPNRPGDIEMGEGGIPSSEPDRADRFNNTDRFNNFPPDDSHNSRSVALLHAEIGGEIGNMSAIVEGSREDFTPRPSYLTGSFSNAANHIDFDPVRRSAVAAGSPVRTTSMDKADETNHNGGTTKDGAGTKGGTRAGGNPDGNDVDNNDSDNNNGSENNNHRPCGSDSSDESNCTIPTSTRCSLWVQVWALTVREYQGLWRNPFAVYVMWGIPMIQMVLFGFVYWQMGNEIRHAVSREGVPNRDPGSESSKAPEEIILEESKFTGRLTAFFGVLGNLQFIAMMSVGQSSLVKIPAQMSVFLREYSANMYGTVAYFLSMFVVELPLLIIHATLLLTAAYFFFAMHGSFFWLWITTFIGCLCGSSLGAMVSCIAGKNAAVSVIISPIILASLPNSFSGVFRSAKEMGSAVSWLQYIIPYKYTCAGCLYFELNPDVVVDYLPTGDELQKMIKEMTHLPHGEGIAARMRLEKAIKKKKTEGIEMGSETEKEAENSEEESENSPTLSSRRKRSRKLKIKRQGGRRTVDDSESQRSQESQEDSAELSAAQSNSSNNRDNSDGDNDSHTGFSMKTASDLPESESIPATDGEKLEDFENGHVQADVKNAVTTEDLKETDADKAIAFQDLDLKQLEELEKLSDLELYKFQITNDPYFLEHGISDLYQGAWASFCNIKGVDEDHVPIYLGWTILLGVLYRVLAWATLWKNSRSLF